MKSRHGWDVVCKTGARATSPARKSVNPGCRRRFSTRWSAPRRRSASTSNVRCFAYENASARLELTNDFPSPLPGLVTVTTIGPEAGSYSFTKLRRRPRNASTTASGLVAPFPLAFRSKCVITPNTISLGVPVQMRYHPDHGHAELLHLHALGDGAAQAVGQEGAR